MMEIHKYMNPHGRGQHDPHTVIWHAMGQYIKCDPWSVRHFGKKGIKLSNGTIYHATEWLKMIGLSAHFMVEGKTVIECKDPKDVAYHAKGHNTGFIGVELLVPGVFDSVSQLYRKINGLHWIPADQYGTAVSLQKELDKTFGKRLEMTTHSGVDERLMQSGDKLKQDPGKGFPFRQFMQDCGH